MDAKSSSDDVSSRGEKAAALLAGAQIDHRLRREVVAMEETESGRIEVSGESFGGGETEGLSSGERTNLGCYEQCMNDAYDLNNDAFCASVCGFEV